MKDAATGEFLEPLKPFQKRPRKDHRLGLQGRQVGIKVGDGLDAAEIVFEGDVFVGGVGIFIGQPEA